jgi:hypothetical protein
VGFAEPFDDDPERFVVVLEPGGVEAKPSQAVADSGRRL